MDTLKKITACLIVVLLIAICLLLGQCKRSGEFAKKYNDTQNQLNEALENNRELKKQVATGTAEIKRLTAIATAEHARIAELEKLVGKQGKINSELEKYFDGNAAALDDADRAIAESTRAIAEIEKYYKSKSIK